MDALQDGVGESLEVTGSQKSIVAQVTHKTLQHSENLSRIVVLLNHSRPLSWDFHDIY